MSKKREKEKNRIERAEKKDQPSQESPSSADSDGRSEQYAEPCESSDVAGEQQASETAQAEGEEAQAGAKDQGQDLESQLRARIAELEAENSELKEQYLRKQADFENYRKRMNREKQDSARFANKQLLLDIVPVIDDFERAIKSAEESRDFDALHDGVALIEKQFTGMLERKWGLQRFDSEGEEFDPQKHEAVAVVEESNVETPTVAEEYQKGYMLHDMVLRAAKVRVRMPAQSQGQGNEQGQTAASEESGADGDGVPGQEEAGAAETSE